MTSQSAESLPEIAVFRVFHQGILLFSLLIIIKLYVVKSINEAKMKRTLLFFIGLSWYALALTQGSITSITPNSAQQGQTINVTIMGQNTTFASASGAALYGGNPYIYLARTSQTVISPTEVNATFNIPSSMAPGLYSLELYPAMTYYAFAVNPTSANPSTVQGTIYIDSDSNCVVGPAEPRVTNGVVVFTPGPYYAISDTAGNFTANIPNGNYTATYSPGWGYAIDCPVSQTYTVNVATPGSSANNLNFGLDSFPSQDIYIYSSSPFIRRGIPTNGGLRVYNRGNIPYTGNLTFVKDPLVNVTNISPAPASNANDTLVWPITLAGDDNTVVYFNLTGDLQLQLGDTVSFVCYADTPAIDINPANNRQEFDRVVIGSFDPNDKAVTLPSGANADGIIGMNDTTLIYRVRFQNTGTDTAFTVTIRDTMDSRLDLSSLRVIASSHAFTINLDPYGRVEFNFPNIMLPDSFVNEPASNGYIVYEVNRFSNTPEGNTITNRASIYFDFNPPVLTNMVGSQLCAPISAGFTSSASAFAVSLHQPVQRNHLGNGPGISATAVQPQVLFLPPILMQVAECTMYV